MHTYLEAHIKPLMDRFPALGGLLEAAGVGCTTCSLGTCRVQDILEIHDLDTERIRVLLTAMGKVIYGDAPFEVPEIRRESAAPKANLCPPLRRLMEEHTYIKRVIACLPALAEALRQDFAGVRPLAERTLEFIRAYADRYHHAKEEDLLFGYLEPDSDILRVMLQDHVDGRDHVKAVSEGLARKDFHTVESHLRAYGALLSGHIQREDTILYPWIDRKLTDRQVGELFAACMAVEGRFEAVSGPMEAFVAELERGLMVP